MVCAAVGGYLQVGAQNMILSVGSDVCVAWAGPRAMELRPERQFVNALKSALALN
jgi:hypothetical protein